jgi:hypothetical protein
MVPNAKFVAFKNGKSFAPLARARRKKPVTEIESAAGCRRDVRGWPMGEWLPNLFAAREAGSVQVFRRRHCETIHALGRPASEKRQGTKSRWVGHRRCSGLYGELALGCGAGRFDRSGRAGRFGSNVGCARGGERVNGVLRDPIDAVPGQSGVSTQVGAPPVESRSEWRVSVRWWISDDGIMRCRS